MDQFSYTRPREKLRDRGATSLTPSELLQVIIGSGTKEYTAPRVAKSVLKKLEEGKGDVTYEVLLSVKGVGHTKACQILAAIEFGRRNLGDGNGYDKNDQFVKLGRSTKQLIEFTTYSGDNQRIKTRTQSFTSLDKAHHAIRQMFSYAMHDLANSLMIGIGMRSSDVTHINDEMLSHIKKIFETADLLEIRVSEVYLVNQKERYPMTRKALKL
jgi:DNA repair protein RadC